MKITLDTAVKTLEILEECTLEELNKFIREAGISEDWKIKVTVNVITIGGGIAPEKPYNPWTDPYNPYKVTYHDHQMTSELNSLSTPRTKGYLTVDGKTEEL